MHTQFFYSEIHTVQVPEATRGSGLQSKKAELMRIGGEDNG